MEKENRMATKWARGQVWKASTDNGTVNFMVAAVIPGCVYGATVGDSGDAIFENPENDTQAIATELIKIPSYRLTKYLYAIPDFVVNEWGHAVSKVAIGESCASACVNLLPAPADSGAIDGSLPTETDNIENDASEFQTEDIPLSESRTATELINPISNLPLRWTDELSAIRDNMISRKGFITTDDAKSLAIGLLGKLPAQPEFGKYGDGKKKTWSTEARMQFTILHEFFGSKIIPHLYAADVASYPASRIGSWEKGPISRQDVVKARETLRKFTDTLIQMRTHAFNA